MTIITQVSATLLQLDTQYVLSRYLQKYKKLNAITFDRQLATLLITLGNELTKLVGANIVPVTYQEKNLTQDLFIDEGVYLEWTRGSGLVYLQYVVPSNYIENTESPIYSAYFGILRNGKMTTYSRAYTVILDVHTLRQTYSWMSYRNLVNFLFRIT